MKKVLSLLLSFAFFEAQAFALHGPIYPGSAGGISLTGTYAGVLLPKSESNPQPGASSSASIGLFSIGVDATGIATGTAIIFIDGVAYNGNVTAVADPDFDTVKGVIEGVSDFTIETPEITGTDAAGNDVVTDVQSNLFAQGNLDCTVSQALDPTVVNGVQLSTGIRISGKSTFQLFAVLNPVTGVPEVDDTVVFTVDGFQQVSTTSTATTLTVTTPTSNGGSGGSGT